MFNASIITAPASSVRRTAATCTGLALALALTFTGVTSAHANSTHDQPAPGIATSDLDEQFGPISSRIEIDPSAGIVTEYRMAPPAVTGEESRAVPWAVTLGAVVAAGGGVDYMGNEAAQKMLYAGLRNPEYQQIKWSLRASAIGLLGPVFGAVFITAFENKFYSMI